MPTFSTSCLYPSLSKYDAFSFVDRSTLPSIILSYDLSFVTISSSVCKICMNSLFSDYELALADCLHYRLTVLGCSIQYRGGISKKYHFKFKSGQEISIAYLIEFLIIKYSYSWTLYLYFSSIITNLPTFSRWCNWFTSLLTQCEPM